MNKYFRITFVLMILSIICSVGVSKAYEALDGKAFNKINIPARKTYVSDIYTKKTQTSQQYANDGSFTAFTKPCNDCKIKSELFQNNIGSVSTLTSVADQIKEFNILSQEQRDYYLEISRADFTLLDTEHYAVWAINGHLDIPN